jgi:DNA-binding transcriptional ArsR family regulator
MTEQSNINEVYVREMAKFYKVLGDETRLKILYALSQKERCVSDLVDILDMSQSSVSHQLRILRDNGQVRTRRDGRNIYYSLDDQHVLDIFQEALQHIVHRMEEGKIRS